MTSAHKKNNPKPGRPARKKIFSVKDIELLREIKRKAFAKQVRAAVLANLPPAPYKIGIHKDMFELLKAQFPGRHTKLRRTINGILMRMSESYRYQIALTTGTHRHGLDGRVYPLDQQDKKHSRRKLVEICEKRKHLTRKSKRK